MTPRRGTVLIVTMLVVFAIASLTLTLGRTARTEAMVSANELAAFEASAIARGAEQYVLSILTDDFDYLSDYTEADFAAVPVGTGYFWIVRPDYNDQNLPAFGLVDETAKLDINNAGFESLRLLESMTDEIAGAIVDWRDTDDNLTQSGAESGQYLSLSDPYIAKNAPFESVEEMMLIRGVNRVLLYGERAAGTTSKMVNAHVALNGWYDYLTIYSGQANTAADGTARININSQQSRQQLRQLLRDQLGETRGNALGSQINGQYVDIFDFATRLELTLDELQLLEDYITASNPQNRVNGRINVNAAPREVLLCVEGLEEADVDTLISRRPTEVQANPTSIAWVYDSLKEKAVGIGNRICGQGRQFSADIIAMSGNGRGFKRVRIVVDAGATTPRIVYRRDISERGNPLDASIRQSLRSGGGLGNYSYASVTGGMR